MKFISIYLLYIGIFESHTFIIPDEVPSLLSIIYSNIPTIKKGTDSRLGWGFRLGDRADFQVLVELGPQTNTQPLRNQQDNGNSKRNTADSLSDILYAQRQKDKQKQKKFQSNVNKDEIVESDGGTWLQNWSKNMKKSQQPQVDIEDLPNVSQEGSVDLPLEPRPGLGIGEIDAKSVIPDDTTLALEELYKLRAQLQKNAENATETIKQSNDITTSGNDESEKH